MLVKTCCPAPAPHKPRPPWLRWSHGRGMALPGILQKGPRTSTCLAPRHHAWGGCHGRVSTLAPSPPFPWRETLQGTPHHVLEVPGELEEPQPQTEGGYAPFPKRVPCGASRKGGVCQYVPPTARGDGRGSSVLFQLRLTEKQRLSPPRARDSGVGTPGS